MAFLYIHLKQAQLASSPFHDLSSGPSSPGTTDNTRVVGQERNAPKGGKADAELTGWRGSPAREQASGSPAAEGTAQAARICPATAGRRPPPRLPGLIRIPKSSEAP